MFGVGEDDEGWSTLADGLANQGRVLISGQLLCSHSNRKFPSSICQLTAMVEHRGHLILLHDCSWVRRRREEMDVGAVLEISHLVP